MRPNGSVTIRGRLKPAEGGETAVLSYRQSGRTSWSTTRVRVASNGTFSFARKLRRSTFFVAQWRGDDDRQADGTPVLTVRVRR